MGLYDSTFNSHTLQRQLRAHDIHTYPVLNDPVQRDAHVAQAVALARKGFQTLNLSSHELKGATIYQPSSIQEDLVLRKAQENLKRITSVKQSDRLDIIRCIQSLCAEGVPYRVYKIDIKKFYESVDTESLVNSLKQDIPNSPASLLVIGSFFGALTKLAIPGLPRGLAISAVLSEYLLRRFDKAAYRKEGVFYYARYVDDMLFITKGDEAPKQFFKLLSSKLPPGLGFNNSKTWTYDFLPYDKNNADKLENTFDFLGYQFAINTISKNQERTISLDIAPKKVKRAKTRLVVSFRRFISDGNFKDLEDRIKILTSNYSFFDHKEQVKRLAGIYYSYRLIDMPSNGLKELDIFLKKMILSNTGNVCGQLSKALSLTQRRKLLKYSFHRNFEDRNHFDFSNQRLETLIRCWKYA